MNAIAILPAPHDNVIRFAPARAAASNRRAAADPNRFADGMETAMTGLVVTGGLLFAAGLVHVAGIVCAASLASEDALRTLACLSGAATMANIFWAILGNSEQYLVTWPVDHQPVIASEAKQSRIVQQPLCCVTVSRAGWQPSGLLRFARNDGMGFTFSIERRVHKKELLTFSLKANSCCAPSSTHRCD